MLLEELAVTVTFASPKSRILAWPAFGDENIGGLDVAVHDPFRVRGIQGVGDLNSQLQHLLGWQRLAGNAVLQGERRPETPWR